MFCKTVEMVVILIEENQKRAIRIINNKTRLCLVFNKLQYQYAVYRNYMIFNNFKERPKMDQRTHEEEINGAYIF